MEAMRQAPKLVTVFGGSGFVGRNVVRALARRGYRIRVAVRRPNLAFFLQPLGTVGQIELVQANLRYDGSIERALVGADAVVNCVGILGETGRQTFDEVQAGGPRAIAHACPAGVPIVHVSALGAHLLSPSRYGRTKAQGEAAVLSERPNTVVFRPSLVFGQGDSFFNRFAALARMLPVLPLAGAGTRFQPVFVGDVAEAVARGVDGTVPGGRIYELGGPETRTLTELVDYVLAVIERKRLVVPLPFGVARVQARMMELVDTLSFGLLPDMLKLTGDQVELLRVDNVVSAEAIAEDRTLAGIGIAPRAMESIVPEYLVRFRKTGQFDVEPAA